jgi:hypothetical protein
LPGVPLFVLTHHVPDTVSAGDPPYAFVTDGIERAVEQAGPPPRARMWPSWGRRSCARASRRSARCARHQPGAGGAGARRPPAGRPGARERPARPSPSHRRPGRHPSRGVEASAFRPGRKRRFLPSLSQVGARLST